MAVAAAHGDTAEGVALAVRVFAAELEIPLFLGVGGIGRVDVPGKRVPVEYVLHVFADLHFHVVDGEEPESGGFPLVRKT